MRKLSVRFLFFLLGGLLQYVGRSFNIANEHDVNGLDAPHSAVSQQDCVLSEISPCRYHVVSGSNLTTSVLSSQSGSPLTMVNTGTVTVMYVVSVSPPHACLRRLFCLLES